MVVPKYNNLSANSTLCPSISGNICNQSISNEHPFYLFWLLYKMAAVAYTVFEMMQDREVLVKTKIVMVWACGKDE